MCSPTWETHILNNDMGSPTQQTHIPSKICVPLPGKKKNPSTMCSPTQETHIPSDMHST